LPGQRHESAAVVADVQRHLVIEVGQGEADPAGVGVLGHVGQGLLGGTQQGQLGLLGQGPDGAGGGDGGRDAGGHAVQRGPALGDQAEGLLDAAVLERLGPQGVHGPPGLGQALAGQLQRGVEVPAPLVLPADLVGRLELGDDPGQALGHGVVDLAGHPLPFVGHAGLPGLGQQLLVQAGVLGQGDLQHAVGLAELGHGPAALLALLGALEREPDDAAGHQHVDRDQAAVEGDGPGGGLGQPAVLGGGRDHGDGGHAGQPPPAGQT
jgi:hypothetical protein